jgi:hypothetical protein
MRIYTGKGLAVVALVMAAIAPTGVARAQADTGMGKGGMSHGAMFMKGTKSVAGTCMVAEDQGQHFLTFSNDFMVENSPQPYVALTMTAGSLGDSPVWVGAVQRMRGTQRYLIPKGTDLTHYTHVLIYDKTTHATLATADLSSGGAMSGM